MCKVYCSSYLLLKSNDFNLQDKLRLPSSTDIYLLTEFIGKNEAGEKCLLDWVS